jgi:hypothetical protein
MSMILLLDIRLIYSEQKKTNSLKTFRRKKSQNIKYQTSLINWT